jgi:hypothetical protein
MEQGVPQYQESHESSKDKKDINLLFKKERFSDGVLQFNSVSALFTWLSVGTKNEEMTRSTIAAIA